MIFFLKKLVGGLLMPLPLFLILVFLAWCLNRTGWRVAGRSLGLAALLGLYLASTAPVAYLVAKPLEYAYPPYQGQPLDAVIVLGGYHRSDTRVPITSLLSATSMVRLSEGVRVMKQNEGARLCLSGYSGRDAISNAEAMAQVAIAVMEVDSARILQHSEPQDTRGEAQIWSKSLAGMRVGLVTSAMHLPRAMYLFHEQGLQPLPIPTNFRSGSPDLSYWRNWVPNVNALHTVTAAWHEYLGLTWARLQSN